jgi:hypothetical protein
LDHQQQQQHQHQVNPITKMQNRRKFIWAKPNGNDFFLELAEM